MTDEDIETLELLANALVGLASKAGYATPTGDLLHHAAADIQEAVDGLRRSYTPPGPSEGTIGPGDVELGPPPA